MYGIACTLARGRQVLDFCMLARSRQYKVLFGHDSSLSNCLKQKQSPPWTHAVFQFIREGDGLRLGHLLSDVRLTTLSLYKECVNVK